MKVICIRGGCEWLNGYMCRAYCEYMRVIRTPAEIQADKRREATAGRRSGQGEHGGKLRRLRRSTSDKKRVFEAIPRFEPGN